MSTFLVSSEERAALEAFIAANFLLSEEAENLRRNLEDAIVASSFRMPDDRDCVDLDRLTRRLRGELAPPNRHARRRAARQRKK